VLLYLTQLERYSGESRLTEQQQALVHYSTVVEALPILPPLSALLMYPALTKETTSPPFFQYY
jgi:hypothetical protein